MSTDLDRVFESFFQRDSPISLEHRTQRKIEADGSISLALINLSNR